VEAALSRSESNGQTEGQVTRLKLIKREMYGRAKFDLLRLRVIHAASACLACGKCSSLEQSRHLLQGGACPLVHEFTILLRVLHALGNISNRQRPGHLRQRWRICLPGDFPAPSRIVHGFCGSLAKLAGGKLFLEAGPKQRLHPSQGFITIPPMLNHETGNREKVTWPYAGLVYSRLRNSSKSVWHVLPSESTAPHAGQRSDISFPLDIFLRLIFFPGWKMKSLLAIPVPKYIRDQQMCG
jgi:hypothetical protein